MGVGIKSSPSVHSSSLSINELHVVYQAYGANADLYEDVLEIPHSASPEEVQMAYFERRNELFSLLAAIDADDEKDQRTKNYHREITERKLSSVAIAVAVLGDIHSRAEYDNLILRPHTLTPPVLPPTKQLHPFSESDWTGPRYKSKKMELPPSYVYNEDQVVYNEDQAPSKDPDGDYYGPTDPQGNTLQDNYSQISKTHNKNKNYHSKGRKAHRNPHLDIWVPPTTEDEDTRDDYDNGETSGEPWSNDARNIYSREQENNYSHGYQQHQIQENNNYYYKNDEDVNKNSYDFGKNFNFNRTEVYEEKSSAPWGLLGETPVVNARNIRKVDSESDVEGDYKDLVPNCTGNDQQGSLLELMNTVSNSIAKIPTMDPGNFQRNDIDNYEPSAAGPLHLMMSKQYNVDNICAGDALGSSQLPIKVDNDEDDDYSKDDHQQNACNSPDAHVVSFADMFTTNSSAAEGKVINMPTCGDAFSPGMDVDDDDKHGDDQSQGTLVGSSLWDILVSSAPNWNSNQEVDTNRKSLKQQKKQRLQPMLRRENSFSGRQYRTSQISPYGLTEDERKFRQKVMQWDHDKTYWQKSMRWDTLYTVSQLRSKLDRSKLRRQIDDGTYTSSYASKDSNDIPGSSYKDIPTPVWKLLYSLDLPESSIPIIAMLLIALMAIAI